MSRQRFLEVADQRVVTPRLQWLTLHAPELVREVRAGQYLLVRCTEPGSYDPLLRRALFVAATEPALGQIGLLYAPDELGLRWLARARPSDMLDVIGPLGRPFALESRSRAILLVGSGAGLAALLLLARDMLARGGAATLLAAADEPDLLPPAYLLPADVEYETVLGRAIDLLKNPQVVAEDPADAERNRLRERLRVRAQAGKAPQTPVPPSPIAWADQVFAALPQDELPVLRDLIQAAKYRWERGFASTLVSGPLVCGVGACGACMVELRKSPKLLCSDGPVFDLRDVIGS